MLHTLYDNEHGSDPLSVALAPDGHTVAAGYPPYDIIIWDARDGRQLCLLEGHSNWVVSLAFSADSKRLIPGGGDGTARVWDPNGWAEIGRLRLSGASTYTCSVGISPDGTTAFALTGGDLTVATISVSTSRAFVRHFTVVTRRVHNLLRFDGGAAEFESAGPSSFLFADHEALHLDAGLAIGLSPIP